MATCFALAGEARWLNDMAPPGVPGGKRRWVPAALLQ
jgi:hypothetical protein